MKLVVVVFVAILREFYPAVDILKKQIAKIVTNEYVVMLSATTP